MIRQLATQAGNRNLLSNGAFDRIFKLPTTYVDTSDAYSGYSYEVTQTVPERVYVPTLLQVTAPTKYVGSWAIDGSAAISVDNKVLSRDGGNVLQVRLLSGEPTTLTQTIADPRVTAGVTTLSFSGVHLHGSPVVSVQFYLGDSLVLEQSYSSSTFTTYRRMQKTISLDEGYDRVVFQITGVAGSHVGLSGVTLVRGGAGSYVPYVPSWEDLYIPTGAIILFDADECPQGYIEMIGEDHMLIVGAPAAQEFGLDEHVHSVNSEGPATEAKSLRLLGFHQYPSTVPYAPYPGEQPELALGVAHSHTLSDPPPGLPECVRLKIGYRI